MPPKKDKTKVKVSKKDKTENAKTKQGVKINIHIDQSKKTRGVAPKPPVVRRMLPAFSSVPQGASYLGAHIPARQDAPININKPSITAEDIGKSLFNSILAETRRREEANRGFGGFQTAGEQANTMFGGVYRMGNSSQPIVSDIEDSATERAIDNAVMDNPTTNNILEENKLEHRGQVLPKVAPPENSLGELNAEERRDNALDNLVLHETKSATEKKAEKSLNENLLEENEEDEEYILNPITKPAEQKQKQLELSLEDYESQYRGKNVTKEIFNRVDDAYNGIYKIPDRRASIQDLKDYIEELNNAFNTNYPTDFKGAGAREKLNRIIRVAILKANDDI